MARVFQDNFHDFTAKLRLLWGFDRILWQIQGIISCNFEKIGIQKKMVKKLVRDTSTWILFFEKKRLLVTIFLKIYTSTQNRSLKIGHSKINWVYVHALLTLQLIDVNDGMLTNSVPNGRWYVLNASENHSDSGIVRSPKIRQPREGKAPLPKGWWFPKD